MKQPEGGSAPRAVAVRDPRIGDPEALAKRAITLLERYLRDTYHLKVQMGIELEYSLILKPDAPALMNSPSVVLDPLRLGRYEEHPRPRLFKLSRFVAYSYPEGHGAKNTSKSYFQYEMVTDHTHPMPLHLLPNAINILRKELTHGGDQMLKADRTLCDPPATTAITKWNITHPRRIHQAKWYNGNVSEVRFDSQREGKITNGLHLNFSLIDIKSGNPILKSMNPLMTALVDTTNRYFTDEAGLIEYTYEQRFRSDTRRKQGAYPLVTIRNTDTEDKTTPAPKGMPCYLENKTPPADCNTYYAVMCQLAAITDSVDQIHGREASNMTKLLNRLEPYLGTRFEAAERDQPKLRSCHTMPNIAFGHSRGVA